jgi:hypothetical protein
MPLHLRLARDLSWVNAPLAARLADGVQRLHSAIAYVAPASHVLGLREALLDVEDALLFHHPQRRELERLVAELRARAEGLRGDRVGG